MTGVRIRFLPSITSEEMACKLSQLYHKHEHKLTAEERGVSIDEADFLLMGGILDELSSYCLQVHIDLITKYSMVLIPDYSETSPIFAKIYKTMEAPVGEIIQAKDNLSSQIGNLEKKLNPVDKVINQIEARK